MHVSADGHDRIEGRHRLGKRGGFATIDEQGHFGAFSSQRNVLPLARIQRLRGDGALAIDLHKRHALVCSDQ
ncbi:hypothetical protein D3C87_1069380 [compost metagenome]